MSVYLQVAAVASRLVRFVLSLHTREQVAVCLFVEGRHLSARVTKMRRRGETGRRLLLLAVLCRRGS